MGVILINYMKEALSSNEGELELNVKGGWPFCWWLTGDYFQIREH